MAVNTNTIVSNVYAQNYTPGSKEKTKVARNTETGEVKKEEKVTESKDLGKTIGDPKLSKEAQKYYEKLKKKYGNYDFILVSKDQKANAQANAAKYANNIKTVVLIDEEKIERMATDESYRKKYEGILSGATAQLQQLKSSVEKSGADVKEYGMQVNDECIWNIYDCGDCCTCCRRNSIPRHCASLHAEIRPSLGLDSNIICTLRRLSSEYRAGCLCYLHGHCRRNPLREEKEPAVSHPRAFRKQPHYYAAGLCAIRSE